MMEDESPWHDDDSFWEKTMSFMFDDIKLGEAPTEVTALIELLEIEHGDVILDLSCGVGRHTNEFARRGYSITGVDRTEVYLTKAREDAEKENLFVRYIQSDMREYINQAAYDLVLSMYTSFGFFEDNNEQQLVLDNIFASLKSGGRFVMQVIGKEIHARKYVPILWSSNDTGVLVIKREIIEEGNREKMTQTLIEKNGSKHTWVVTHYLYSADEFKGLLESTGFVDVQVFGSIDGAPYDSEAMILMVIGTKP